MTENELVDLLNESRAANLMNNITGLLLYKQGAFMQVIEGEYDKIEQLFENIKNDNRHFEVIRLLKEEISEREFPEWSMGFQNVSNIEIEGFSNVFKSRHSVEKDEESQGIAKSILLSFSGKY